MWNLRSRQPYETGTNTSILPCTGETEAQGASGRGRIHTLAGRHQSPALHHHATPSQEPTDPRTVPHGLSFGNTRVTEEHGNRSQDKQAGFYVQPSERDPALP